MVSGVYLVSEVSAYFTWTLRIGNDVKYKISNERANIKN